MGGSLEEERQGLIRVVGELYAHGTYSEDEMNAALDRIAVASNLDDLKLVVEVLPALRQSPGFPLMTNLIENPVQVVSARSGTVRKTGTWVQSRLLRVEGSSSSFKLDLLAYDGAALSLEMELDLRSCSLVVVVPMSFAVDEAIGSNVSSSVSIRVKGSDNPASGRLVLRGSIRSSSVKIVAKQGPK